MLCQYGSTLAKEELKKEIVYMQWGITQHLWAGYGDQIVEKETNQI